MAGGNGVGCCVGLLLVICVRPSAQARQQIYRSPPPDTITNTLLNPTQTDTLPSLLLPSPLQMATRPRRASRAPVKNDENAPSQSAAAQPRLIGKSSVASLAAAGRLAGKAAGVTVPVGKAAVGGAGVGGPRRAAFGEVTNNVQRVSIPCAGWHATRALPPAPPII